MELLKAKIKSENNSKITIFLDTKVEINIITRKIIKNTRLIIKQRLKLELVLHSGYSGLFLGLL